MSRDEQWRRFDALVAALAEAERPGEVTAVIAERAGEAVGASGCVVALLDESGRTLELHATGQKVGLEAPLPVAEAARTRRPVGGAVPMLAGKRVIGALAFTDPPDGLVATERFVEAIAAQAAHAIERAQLLEAERDAREAARNAAERVAFLAEATVLLAANLELDATLSSLARLVVPRLADWCLVTIARADGTSELAALHHWDPERHAGIAELLAQWPEGMTSPYGASAVMDSGTAQLFPTVPDAMLQEIAGGDEQLLARLRWLAPATGMVVPLTARGRPIGALTMARDRGSPYGGAQLSLAEDLGRSAGLAVDNARVGRERDEAAAQAAAERDRLAALLDQLPVGVLVAEAPSGRIVLSNTAVEEALGDTTMPMSSLDRALRSGEVVRAERIDVAAAAGALPRCLEVNAGPVRDRLGRITGAVAVVTDITQRVEREEALARSTARSLQLASSLQASLLPPDLPQIPEMDLAAVYQAVGEGLDVGGDFYDVYPTGRDDEWALVIGDVCGKGVEAAAVTSLARYTLRAASIRARRPSVILSELNQAMLRQETERPFVTAVYAVLRSLRPGVSVTFAIGGHPAPLVVRADGQVEKTGEHGALIGVVEDPGLVDASVTLASGDALVLYTDGVTEARRGREQFGEERLAAALGRRAGQSARLLVAEVEAALAAFTQEPARDDVALIVVRAS